MLKSEDDAWIFFENLAENSLHHSSSGRRAPASKNQKSETIFEVRHPLDVTTKVDALSRKLDQIMIAGFEPTAVPHIPSHRSYAHFAQIHRIRQKIAPS
jgi:hypothetical protein